jgi:enolase-phosphatase E1
MTASIRGILLDIEGTTTPIAFVHQVLFQYARSHIKDYVSAHFGFGEVLSDLSKLRAEHAADVERDSHPPKLSENSDNEIDSITAYLQWLIDRDSKSIALKSLQGKIWKEGYLDGTLKAPLFKDVAPALWRWSRRGLSISIFSSGSSLAQQLLFAHTEAGDLTGCIDNYFDTTVGPKKANESYRRIASALHLPATQMLFISDVVAELDAAGEAGMQTRLCIRPGNQPESSMGHKSIQSFDEIRVSRRVILR